MKFDPPYFKGLNLDYKAEMLLGNLTLSNLGNLATFTIHLERKFLRDVVEIIGPATLLVLVSWVRGHFPSVTKSVISHDTVISVQFSHLK